MNKSMCVLNITIAREKYFVSFDWNTLNFSNGEDYCFKEKIMACINFSYLTIESQCFITSLTKMVLDAQEELKSKLIKSLEVFY